MHSEYRSCTKAVSFDTVGKSLFGQNCKSTRPLAMTTLPLFLTPLHSPPWYGAIAHYVTNTLPTCAASCLGKTSATTVLKMSFLMLNFWRFGQPILFATCLLLLMVLKLLATMTDQHSDVQQALRSSRRPSLSSCPTKMQNGMSSMNLGTQPCQYQSTISSRESRRMRFEREVRSPMPSET